MILISIANKRCRSRRIKTKRHIDELMNGQI